MYTLYYAPSACSLATHVLLNDLNVPFQAINRNKATNFEQFESNNAVPVLVDDGQPILEGAAIILHLLEKNNSPQLPKSGIERARFIQWVMFANATMHPAYGRMFFIFFNMEDSPAKQQALLTAAKGVEKLWLTVERQLQKTRFVTGDKMSIVDVMLAVYARWEARFQVKIAIPLRVQQMLDEVYASPSFIKSLKEEEEGAK